MRRLRFGGVISEWAVGGQFVVASEKDNFGSAFVGEGFWMIWKKTWLGGLREWRSVCYISLCCWCNSVGRVADL